MGCAFSSLVVPVCSRWSRQVLVCCQPAIMIMRMLMIIMIMWARLQEREPSWVDSREIPDTNVITIILFLPRKTTHATTCILNIYKRLLPKNPYQKKPTTGHWVTPMYSGPNGHHEQAPFYNNSLQHISCIFSLFYLTRNSYMQRSI